MVYPLLKIQCIVGVRSRPASAVVHRPHTSSSSRPLTLGQRERPDGAGMLVIVAKHIFQSD